MGSNIESPVTSFRKNLGLTRAELARRSGICYVTLSNLENRYVVGMSKSVQKRLSSVGAPDDLAERYRQWRVSIGKQPDLEE